MNEYGGMKVLLHSFLNCALLGGGWSVSLPTALSQWIKPPATINREMRWTLESL